MILHIEEIDSIVILLEIVREFGKVASYEINTQHSTAIVNSSTAEKECVRSIPLTVAKTVNTLG